MQFETLDRHQAQNILHRIWNHPALSGVYLDPFQDPEHQEKLDISQVFELEAQEWMALKGVAKLPQGSVACSTVVITLTGLPEGTTEQDVWVDVCFPLGSLDGIFPVEAYPFDSEDVDHEPWVRVLENWLADLGQYVFEVHPFQMALIGFETSGMADANDLKDHGPPAKRGRVYLWPEHGKLVDYPRTERA
ncbi:hypothetical protein [Deinococcus cellulosilyticus]|uniref:Uncharacterized protein n=1 Tax=Deinococcus cellulosilyticus (strain DSM 18568 / NBRC 106333 / KACC 11606 / 5516J-15) TaxID=1223518 RepID=A0A511MX99_DEIC1|nr:hypothetical protein [Deinococcus cellulosilyticus]GEM44777.1 hypothetical protein DC3_04120 [Deinococcus cellulosilyticus NBRC 106333 = KACC 11606]